MPKNVRISFLLFSGVVASWGCQTAQLDSLTDTEASHAMSELDAEWLEQEVPFDGEYIGPVDRPKLLDEGSCQHLACESGASQLANAQTAGAIFCPQGTRFENQHRLVSFSCLGTRVGCNDDELWLAAPSLNCRAPSTYIVCHEGKSVRVQVRDTSDRGVWEANRGVQKVLGISAGLNPRVRIYEGDVDVSSIPACSDPCVKVSKGACGSVEGQFCNRCAGSDICLPNRQGALSCQPLGNACRGLKAGNCLQLDAISSCGCDMGQVCVPLNGSMGTCQSASAARSPVQFGSGGTSFAWGLDVGRCDAQSARAVACGDVGEWGCEWSTQSCTCGCSKVSTEW